MRGETSHQRESRGVDDRLRFIPPRHANRHFFAMILLERENQLAQIILEGEGAAFLASFRPRGLRGAALQQPLQLARQSPQRRPLSSSPARLHLPVEQLRALRARGLRM